MRIKVLKREFSICKVERLEQVDFTDKYCFVGKTDEEISLICSTKHAPEETISRSDGWRAFRLEGQLDFSLVGVLSEISGILTDGKIPVMAVGTYNTDYILLKKDHLEHALELLIDHDYKIV